MDEPYDPYDPYNHYETLKLLTENFNHGALKLLAYIFEAGIEHTITQGTITLIDRCIKNGTPIDPDIMNSIRIDLDIKVNIMDDINNIIKGSSLNLDLRLEALSQQKSILVKRGVKRPSREKSTLNSILLECFSFDDLSVTFKWTLIKRMKNCFRRFGLEYEKPYAFLGSCFILTL